MLFGRDVEARVVSTLLESAREGRSGVLVVRGDAGIGKTALLDHTAEQASGMTVLRGSGVETEAELPFAGLHQILRPLLDRLAKLPQRQAGALLRAFFLAESDDAHGDDRFLVGLAVLSLLSEAAPLLCLADDAHWLDAASAEALLFAARRLDADGVAIMFAARDEPARFPAAGLPECRLAALAAHSAGRLLDERAPGLDPALRERVLAEADGNPLALTELGMLAQDAEIRVRPADASPRERLIASNLAFKSGDHDATWEISAALVADCRTHGMAGWLVGALQGMSVGQILRGEWADARASVAEGIWLATSIGQPTRAAFLASVSSLLDALAGDEDGCRFWLAEHERLGGPPKPHRNFENTNLGLLALGYGRFAPALGHLEALAEKWISDTEFMFQPDLIEAAARAGEPGLAKRTFAAFEAWAAYTGQPWALAVTARCRALISSPAEAGEHFAEAVRLHDGAGRPFEQARSRLLYGEWLRRDKRRTDAREQLASALGTFERLGARSWAGRARTELQATGLTATRAAQPGPLDMLTPQEYQIIRLAAEGGSNRDIAARLFLSHRTVGYHLYKAFPKLGISSRHELATLFAGQ